MRRILRSYQTAWVAALQSKTFRLQLIVTSFLSLAAFLGTTFSVHLMENRQGIVLNDSFISITSPHDFTYPIFAITYFIIFGTILLTFSTPEYVLKGFQAYSLIFFLRIASIYLFPLNPPNGLIALHDPIIQSIMGDTTPINKDLFYSGHTASLFIMFFIARNRVWKIICFIGAIIVPVLLVWQRVHYTIDVLFAPLAAYCVWWFIEYLHENSSFGLNAVFDKRQD